jgi:DMSO/TMAO reductase YedYZ molybdopterin-dependent catalytic subunit
MDPDRSPLVVVKPAPFNAESAVERLREGVTPAPAFYVRSNFPVPALDPDGHRIAVRGAVERPLDLGLADLRDLGTRTVVTTMECAGNNRTALVPLPTGEPWQSGAVSTGEWTGVPLRAVLERAGLRPDAVEVLVEGADRGRPKDGLPEEIPFARALPTDKALHEDTLLALELNGAPLPADHGAPVRLVVPAWYGMASVKWVARIEALAERFAGYYQNRRYIYDLGDGASPAPVREMLVKSLVVSPREGETVARGRVRVLGRAWSGAGEIVRVEVAVDGGETWQEARLLEEARPSPSPYAWTAWEFDWEAAEPGRHVLRARATDATGQTQPANARWNKYGYGSNGVQPVVVDVA